MGIIKSKRYSKVHLTKRCTRQCTSCPYCGVVVTPLYRNTATLYTASKRGVNSTKKRGPVSVPNIETESKLTNNLIKSLSKGYKLGTDKDQLKFMFLSVYLHALGFAEESEAVSEFISTTCDYTGNENTWHSVGHQILMLARAKRLRGEIEQSKSLVQRIVDEDVLFDSVTKSDHLREELSEYDSNLAMLLSETPKWRCEGFVYMYIDLLCCREFAEVVAYEPIDQVIEKTEPKMENLLRLLKVNL